MVAADIDESGGTRVVSVITRASGNAIFVRTDMSQAADVQAMIPSRGGRTCASPVVSGLLCLLRARFQPQNGGASTDLPRDLRGLSNRFVWFARSDPGVAPGSCSGLRRREQRRTAEAPPALPPR